VLDDVAAGRIAEQPAGKDLVPPPLALGRVIAHEDLNERPGFARHFPRRGPLARGEAHDHIAHAARFAGRHLEVLRQVVALVQQAERGHAFFHRRRLDLARRALGCGVVARPKGGRGIARGACCRAVASLGLGFGGVGFGRSGGAAGQGHGTGQQPGEDAHVQLSGDHAS